MIQQQSKDELLFQQVIYGNIQRIIALFREGAGLEWIDREGKTPLILACLNPDLLDVARTLLELGANANAYRPGRNGGTPLHDAAKSGSEPTVKLLLSYGAEALVENDDCQTPLEVARAKGHTNVVRAIENHICLFSGWLWEIYRPRFLKVLGHSRKVWVVILPTVSHNPKLELAIYPSLQDAQPRNVVAVCKENLEEPKFNQSDPSVIILDNPTILRGRRRSRRRQRHQIQTRIELAPEIKGDQKQLDRFCDACKGIQRGFRVRVTEPLEIRLQKLESRLQVNPPFLNNSQTPVAQATAPPDAEDLDLAMAINASIQSAMAEASVFNPHPDSGASASTSWNNSGNASSLCGLVSPAAPPLTGSGSQWPMNEASAGGNSSQQTQIQNINVPTTQTMIQGPDAIPSAPPVADEIVEDGPIHYPSIDLDPVDIPSSTVVKLPATTAEKKNDEGGSCVICLDAPVEGACVPCGHMAGCMSCLNEVQAKKWGCPVCRAKINQVIRLYVV